VVLLKVAGTEKAPAVTTVKTDVRTVNDLRVTVDFTINGMKHKDDHVVGTLDRRAGLALDGMGGLAVGDTWRGDMLYGGAPVGGTHGFDIRILENRPVQNVRVSVTFTINGEQHYDQHDVDVSAGPVALQLDAMGGTWDGSRWLGDFLRGA
jgi:hypothetical protein